MKTREEMEEIIEIGTTHLVPITSRIPFKTKAKLNQIKGFLQAEHKFVSSVSLQDALDYCILQTFEQLEQKFFGQGLQNESIENIAEEITLQNESTKEFKISAEQIEQRNESKKQARINGYTREELEREAQKKAYFPPSKQNASIVNNDHPIKKQLFKSQK